MIRILFVVLIFAGAYFTFKTLLGFINANRCTNCDGRGYWQGTRGEKNFCETCDGTGRQ